MSKNSKEKWEERKWNEKTPTKEEQHKKANKILVAYANGFREGRTQTLEKVKEIKLDLIKVERRLESNDMDDWDIALSMIRRINKELLSQLEDDEVKK